MENCVLSCVGVSKAFPGVQALDQVNFDLQPGEVHALCGENGAGKSTLIKILTGLYRKDAGEITHIGAAVDFKNPQEARKAGISLIPQELHLARSLTVAENIFMTDYPIKHGIVDWKEMFRKTIELQRKLGSSALRFQPEQLISTLSMGQQQLVEILKAISTDVKVLAFDEPTSSLSDEETEQLFILIKELTRQGIAVIYVSHRLAEIFKICDRVSVLKDGKYVGTRNVSEISATDIISMMVGRDMHSVEKDKRAFNEDILSVEDLCWTDKVKNVSFTLRKGEILGMFGIVGAGRTETARLLFGVEKKRKGVIKIRGKTVRIDEPHDAVKYKMGFVSEDRRGEGLATILNVTQNITMPFVKDYSRSGIMNLKVEKERARESVAKLNIKTPSLETKVADLSGGNQQKTVISKWLGAQSDILIFDEPTRGIDVGAKAEIYKIMNELTKEGKSIIMISSELPEVLTMSDRVLVFRDGEIVAQLEEVGSLTEEQVLAYAIKTQ